MTSGLLVSRSTKNLLYKNYLTRRNNDNFIKYKTYRNLYNSTIKLSKKLTIQNKLLVNKKNPKKYGQSIMNSQQG